MPQGQAVNPLVQLIPFFLIFAIFYFILIRPQVKAQKAKEREHRDMLGALSKNDEVVTSGGIHGVVLNVKDKTVVIRVDDNVKIEVEKNCVAYKVKS